ncbi:hypothetical protein OHA84_37600 (plasmid) [Streptomyces sp. NBC_00513]|uniref:hypothetical protein n=1 Tax=unclassified Streptomyces TaxID=2593676 RepID=UPI00224D7FAA|nr:hypothetical protein [Streptomyces sp. NBC_00424]MCX5078833.1 hypothetical protein [Streptomyces sp. NBC_00424]WUD46247.1 hypothetical protein OHA84_37600 [Streptomyces sp. NBC_00513]
MIVFLREHKDLLLIVLPLVAAFLGTCLGAYIQAKAGIAQAQAAREAAATAASATLGAVREQADRAAEAAHITALRDQRTAAITGFLRTVRELTRALDKQYERADVGAVVDQTHTDFIHALGVIELVATAELSAAAFHVVETVADLAGLASSRAQAARARERLTPLDDGGPATRAIAALDALREASVAADDGYLHQPYLREADEALEQVPELTWAEKGALILDCRYPELGEQRQRLTRTHNFALKAFVQKARTAMGIAS